jgi:hypothetical protein
MTKWPTGRAIGLGVVALLVAVGMAFLATAGPVFSTDGPTVSIEDGETVPGGTDVTRLMAEDVSSPALCAFTVDVVYDPDVKTPSECVADPEDNFPQLADCDVDYADDTVRVQGAIGTAAGVTGNIPLADITWTGVGSAGDSTDLDVQIVEFWDCSAQPVEITPVADQDGVNAIVAPSPTPTPTPSPTPTATATPSPTPTASPTPEVSPTPTETCPPVFPGTYNGSVRLDGVPAPDGTNIKAVLGGIEWASGAILGGVYTLDIPATLPAKPPCFEGGTITFVVAGYVCTPSPEWASGLHTVDVSCEVAPTPTAVVTPTPTAVTPTPPVGPTPTPTALPPTGGGGLLGGGGSPSAAALAAGGVLALLLTTVGLLGAARRRIS